MVAGAIASDTGKLKKYDLSKQEYRLRATTNASLSAMENWPGLAAVGKAGYPLSFMASDFLSRVSLPHTSALRLFVVFWKTIGKGKTWEAAFSAVFGQEAQSFYQGFATYQNNQFQPLTDSDSQSGKQ
jgi:hypothetical protein